MLQILTYIILSVVCTQCAEILGYFPIPSVSHQRVFQNIWQELSLRGHQVTIITPNPLNNSKLINLTEIAVTYSYNFVRHNPNFAIKILAPNASVWPKVSFVNNFVTELSIQHFEDKQVQTVINGNKKYDVILLQPLSKLAFAFPAKFKTPSIGNDLYCSKPQI